MSRGKALATSAAAYHESELGTYLQQDSRDGSEASASTNTAGSQPNDVPKSFCVALGRVEVKDLWFKNTVHQCSSESHR